MSAKANEADPVAIRVNKLDLLEQVADDLAHEIKNPLHSMVINLEVLRRRVLRASEDGAPEMIRYMDVLGNELERVNHRIDLLLRMIRPGRATEPAPLSEIVEEVCELLEMEAGRRSMRAEFDLRAIGARLYVPREPARQLILNLALAALDTLGSGDTLRVEAERVDGAAGGARLRIAGASSQEGGAPAGRPAADAEAVAASARFAVASAMGESLGASVEAEGADGGVAITLSIGATH